MSDQNPEQLAREAIDRQLMACDWVIQDKKTFNLLAGLGVGIQQFPTTSSGVSRICTEKLLLKKSIHYSFISCQPELEEMVLATAQKNNDVEVLKKSQIVTCLIEEQQQIIQEIESRLRVCDELEETKTDCLEQAETLG